MKGRLRAPNINGRREAICLALAGAEVSWVAAIFLGLSSGARPHPPALLWLGMLIVMLGFFYFYRAVARAELPIGAQQGVLVAALLATIFLFVRVHVYAGVVRHGAEWLAYLVDRLSDLAVLVSDEMLAAVLLIYFWGRAIHLARRSLSADSVGYTFRAGVVILVWFGLGVGLLGRRDISPFVVPFFFFALVAIALARIEDISQLPGGSQARFSGYWVGSSVAAVAVVTLIGIGVGIFFYGGGLQPILRLLSPVALLIAAVLAGAALLILSAIQFLVSLLNINWSGVGQAIQELLNRLSLIAAGLSQPDSNPAEPAVLRAFHLTGSLLVIAGLIAFVLLVTWYRLRHSATRQENETRESLPSGSLAQGLADLLRAGRQRLADGLAGLAGRLGAGRLVSALTIRRIYAGLVRLAGEAGYPRATAQTPYEYLGTLRRAFPGSEADTALITEAYVNAHYGQLPDTPEQLQRIRDAWERVRGVQP